MLTSSDGVNFREAAAWRPPAQGSAAFVETVMFEGPTSAQAVSVVMESPLDWEYFGINMVAPLVEPLAFLMTSGAATRGGERCLVARGSGVQAEACLDAIAAGDGREVFEFGDKGQLRSAATGACLVIADGDLANGGRVALEDCRGTLDAGDGRSVWEPTPSGRLQARHMGGHCLGLAGAEATLSDCQGEAPPSLGGEALSLVAVPAFGAAVAAHARDTASLLAAAATRQTRLLAQLRRAVPASGACKLAAVSNTTRFQLPTVALGGQAGRAVAENLDAAGQAVSKIYLAFGVDMEAVQGAIAEGARDLEALRGKLSHV